MLKRPWHLAQQSVERLLKHMLKRFKRALTLETSALESLYGGQFTISYQLCW